MTLSELQKRFYEQIGGRQAGTWETEEYLAPLAGLPDELQQAILSWVDAVWPVSQSLCASFLALAPQAFVCLDAPLREQWVAEMLDIYESRGLRAAQQFMSDVESHFLCRLRGEQGIRLAAVRQRLETFLEGVAGERLEIVADRRAWTDGRIIHLPEVLNVAPTDEENFLLYRLLALQQWRWINSGDFGVLRNLFPAIEDGVENRTSAADHSRLIGDIFLLVGFVRHMRWITNRFAGLAHDTGRILARLWPARTCPVDSQTAFMNWLARQHPTGCAGSSPQPVAGYRALAILHQASDCHNFLPHIYRLHDLVRRLPGTYRGGSLTVLHGDVRPRRAIAGHISRKREQFVQALAAFLVQEKDNAPQEVETENRSAAAAAKTDTASLLLLAGNRKKEDHDSGGRQEVFLQLGGQRIELPAELSRLARSITTDLGNVPADYVASAVGLAGGGALSGGQGKETTADTGHGHFLYDEWDFRRNGFRKNWCHLHLKKVAPVGGSFVPDTLVRHRGLLLKLRRQFEMLRNEERCVRRQPEGDDVDIDAMIDYMADRRAGLGPDERIYLRLRRDERDIAAAFLIDMSSSTEGWILHAMKESLLLMGEALAVLGDRFSISGFSGMRRLRSEYFQVKELDEPFTDEVRQRIAGIMPQDYTRMGPPIRHLTSILADTEARIRLLIILSDGKPEDYDDYKGDYAIEDTRHALIESRAAGVHPFCITVDRQAHDYIAHMYGEVNYVFINDVRQLPARIPAVYRQLTT